MSQKAKNLINLIMAAIGIAMGVAVAVLATIDADVTTTDLIRMLAIAAVALGIFALNNTKT